MVVAIDGPAGSGKSTTARLVAEALGFVHIDTGAMYRAVTLHAIREAVPLDDDEALAEVARNARIELGNSERGPWVRLNGEDVTQVIRGPEVDLEVSRVSEVARVREAVVQEQRRLAEKIDVVMEGRDIGTVVFPDAEVKIYLIATVEERARRRQKELALRGINHELADVLADLQRRDQHDSKRAVAPLRPAPDAVWVDTTDLTVEEQVKKVVARVRAHQESARP
jgi:cytidylate kinase